jgi:hypothetical protein
LIVDPGSCPKSLCILLHLDFSSLAGSREHRMDG